MPPNKKGNGDATLLSDEVPLLSGYGAIAGLSRRALGDGSKANVIAVEVGGNRVYITDLKNAREMLLAVDNEPDASVNVGEGLSDDTVALVIPDNNRDNIGHTVKPLVEPSSSSPGRNESLDQRFVRQFVEYIQRFRVGENTIANDSLSYAPVIITATLILCTLIAVLHWILVFRGGFGFSDPGLLFNYHPVMMITGMFFFSGYAMLTYRGLPWIDKTSAKIVHGFFQLMAIFCIILGLTAVIVSVTLQFPDRPNFTTMHSWLGLFTISLMVTQFVGGLLAFGLGYWRYKDETAKLRKTLVPYHATFGLITFVLGASTALAGLTEKAIYSLQDMYILWTSEEAPYVNAVGTFIVFSAISMVFTLRGGNLNNQSDRNIRAESLS